MECSALIGSVFVPCSCALCNRHNCDDAPPRRGGAAATTSGPDELAGGRHPRPAPSGARRLQPPNSTRPPPLAPPRPTRPCRGDAPRVARLSAPRPAPLLPLWRDTAAVVAWRGGCAHTPPRRWGRARGTSRSWTFLCWGGDKPLPGARPPPSYVPADGGGDEAAGTRPAPAAAHCRAVQRGSFHLFSRVADRAALEETPLPGSHPVVVCGLTCLLGRATSLTVPIQPSPPAGTAAPDASASMQEQLDALRAQLAGTEAARLLRPTTSSSCGTTSPRSILRGRRQRPLR